jgi:hypothetical protein
MALVDQSNRLVQSVEEAAPTQRRWVWSPGRVVAAVALVNLVVALLLFTSRPPWSMPAERALAPVLPAQLAAIQQRIASGHHGESYEVSLSESELSSALSYFATTTPDVPFTNIHARILADHIAVDAVTRGLAVPVPVRADVTLSISNGGPGAHVEEVSVAGAELPAFVHAQVLQQANASLDLSQYELPVTVDSLQQRPGVLDFGGTLK